ncbi:MAG: cupin domain-containing protein [Ginsengibacter sp.]
MTASYYITHLHLQPHPEGGFYKETYRSAENIPQDALPKRFSGERSFCTTIYYLLREGDHSLFHRIKSDECWHFYAGETLLIHVIEPNGNYYPVKLGGNIAAGETLQFVVPAAAWFAAEPAMGSTFSLTGCTVAPGFDFSDFEIADKNILLSAFPECKEVITRLTRQE